MNEVPKIFTSIQVKDAIIDAATDTVVQVGKTNPLLIDAAKILCAYMMSTTMINLGVKKPEDYFEGGIQYDADKPSIDGFGVGGMHP